jgi:hypothetical protein
MSVSEMPTSALLGISAALVALVAVAAGLVAAPSAGAQASRPVPPIDAEAPQATQTATFATG